MGSIIIIATYGQCNLWLQALAEEAALDTGYDLEEEDDALRAAKTPSDLLLDSSTKAGVFLKLIGLSNQFALSSDVMDGDTRLFT